MASLAGVALDVLGPVRRAAWLSWVAQLIPWGPINFGVLTMLHVCNRTIWSAGLIVITGRSFLDRLWFFSGCRHALYLQLAGERFKVSGPSTIQTLRGELCGRKASAIRSILSRRPPLELPIAMGLTCIACACKAKRPFAGPEAESEGCIHTAVLAGRLDSLWRGS